MSPLPMIGEGMGEWLKPLLGHKRGWGVVKKSFLVLLEKKNIEQSSKEIEVIIE